MLQAGDYCALEVDGHHRTIVGMYKSSGINHGKPFIVLEHPCIGSHMQFKNYKVLMDAAFCVAYVNGIIQSHVYTSNVRVKMVLTPIVKNAIGRWKGLLRKRKKEVFMSLLRGGLDRDTAIHVLGKYYGIVY